MRLSANDWQLFTCSMKCGTAAREMTKHLNFLLKEAKKSIRNHPNTRELVAEHTRDTMYTFMRSYSEYGAMDTEPRWVLVDAINKELKTDIGRW